MSNKRYFWLKLKDDFFEQDEIKIVEQMDNGKDYVIFYMKLILKSINTNGELRFKKTIPYSEKMLATITNVNVDIVRSAISVFIELGMMEKWDDGTLFMSETQDMIGSETGSAQRMRRSREAKAIENKPKIKEVSHCDGDVANSDTEIETDKDKEIDINKEKDIKHYGITDEEVDQVVEIWNSILNVPNIRSLSKTSARYKALNARYKEHGFKVILEMLMLVRTSRFLQGDNKENWMPNFGWVLNPENFLKVLEGTYNKDKRVNHERSSSNNQSAPKLSKFQERAIALSESVDQNRHILDELPDDYRF